MRKYIFTLFSSFFLLSLACTKTFKEPTTNVGIKEVPQVPQVPQVQEVYSKDSCYSIIKNRGTISFSLFATCIPPTAKYVEVIYDGDYMGYFLVNKPIYLQAYQGQVKIILMYCTDIGKSLGIRNQFLLK
jgi:hypothetical protein